MSDTSTPVVDWTNGAPPKLANTEKSSSPGMQRDFYSLNDGRHLLIEWPRDMDLETFEEAEAWLRLVRKKMQRCAGSEKRLG